MESAELARFFRNTAVHSLGTAVINGDDDGGGDDDDMMMMMVMVMMMVMMMMMDDGDDDDDEETHTRSLECFMVFFFAPFSAHGCYILRSKRKIGQLFFGGSV